MKKELIYDELVDVLVRDDEAVPGRETFCEVTLEEVAQIYNPPCSDCAMLAGRSNLVKNRRTPGMQLLRILRLFEEVERPLA